MQQRRVGRARHHRRLRCLAGRRPGLRVVESFAVSLDQDGAAVRAGLRLSWSGGQDEGQVSRLKLLRRFMYGRAKLDLLRRRSLLAT
jgi:transposase